MNQTKTVSPLTDYLFQKSSSLRIPLSGTFELTPACNFSCRMCYVRKSPEEIRSHSRPMLELHEWLSIGEQARDAGMLTLLLTGGEPTLWPDFWTLYQELVQMGILVSINTNGSLLDSKAISKLVKNPPRRVNITLYGAGDESYAQLCGVKNTYSKVDKAITELKKAGIGVKLNCSLTPWNAGDLQRMTEYAKEKGVILDITSYMFPPLRRDSEQVGRNNRFSAEEAGYYRLLSYKLQHTEEQYKNYLEGLLKGYVIPPGLDESCLDPIDGRVRCRSGKASFWLTWDGFMMPCGMMTSPKIDTGNNNFKDAWTQLVNVSQTIRLSGVCGNCQNLQICHSCAAMAQTETGQFSGIPKYLCNMVRVMKDIAEKEISTL